MYELKEHLKLNNIPGDIILIIDINIYVSNRDKVLTTKISDK